MTHSSRDYHAIAQALALAYARRMGVRQMTSLGAQAQRMTVERMIVQARREKDQTMSLRMAKRPPRNIWLEVYVNKAGNAEWKYDNKSISAGQAETYLAIYNATLEYRT